MEGLYRELERQVHDLLECDHVVLLLGCPEPVLRHPLVSGLDTVAHGYNGCYGELGSLLLAEEWIRARCDLAIQTGRVQAKGQTHIQVEDQEIHSVAMAPLERPGGILGVLLVADHQPEAFLQGEIRLLASYSRGYSSWLEQQLPSQIASTRPTTTAELERVQARTLQLLREKQRLEDQQRKIITQKHQAESLLSGIADGLIVLEAQQPPDQHSPRFIVSAWNQAASQLTGIETPKALGQRIEKLLPWRDAGGQNLADLAALVLRPITPSLGDGSLQREFLITEPLAKLTSSGVRNSPSLPGGKARVGQNNRWISVHASLVTSSRLDGGPLKQVVYSLRDISVHKEQEQRKNEFLSIITHELRTPLTAIKGYAGLLQAYGIGDRSDPLVPYDEEMTPERQQQYLDIIMDQTGQLEVLVNDLLDVSRLQADQLTIRASEINLALLCQRVVQTIQQREQQRAPDKYRFQCTSAPDLPLVWADGRRVQQVLNNLLENAIKYSPRGGPIEVVAVARRGFVGARGQGKREERASEEIEKQVPLMVYVSVRDQGIGIPRHKQGQLFKPFSRLEHPQTIDVPGVGLGLYIARKLIEAMGGGIILRSSEGKGTSVTFTLPTVGSERPIQAAMTD